MGRGGRVPCPGQEEGGIPLSWVGEEVPVLIGRRGRGREGTPVLAREVGREGKGYPCPLPGEQTEKIIYPHHSDAGGKLRVGCIP